MKKIGIAIVILLGLIIFLWIGARLTNTLQWYVMSTGSNEPTIKIGDKVLASILKSPKRLDFICFYYKDPGDKWSGVRTYRLFGIEGDKLEIKNGVVYVNGVNMDVHLHLKHAYYIPKGEISNRQLLSKVTDIYEVDTATWFFMNDEDAKMEPLVKRYNMRNEVIQDYMHTEWGNNWDNDNFGPVTVPANSYFVIGDNRDNALDSRHIGFISKEVFRGTVLKK